MHKPIIIILAVLLVAQAASQGELSNYIDQLMYYYDRSL